MHRCKADVGDFVDGGECGHDIFPDGGTFDFLAVFAPLFFQFAQHVINRLLAHRTLGAGDPNAAFEFGAAIRFARAVAFDHNERRHFLALERSEAMLAFFTLTAPADGAAFFGIAGIDNSRVVVFAAGTVHEGMIAGKLVRVTLASVMNYELRITNYDKLAWLITRQ